MPRTFALLCALTLTVAAQQPNSGVASLRWNNQGGPQGPITGVQLLTAMPAVMEVSGTPGAPFALAVSGALQQPGFPVLENSLLDLRQADLQLLFDPTLNPVFALSGQGSWQLFGTVPSLPAGIRQAFQAAVYDPTAPRQVTLSAATEVVTAIGQVTIPLSLGDDTHVAVDTSAYGFDLSFYGQTYSALHVASNGFVSYGGSSTDFTASPIEFQSLMPRVALLWCDLSPQNGGSIQATIDQTGPVPTIRVDYLQVPEYANALPHSVSFLQWAAPVGDFQIILPATNPLPTYASMVGVTPGTGLAITAVDLSAAQDAGGATTGANAGLYEWFGYNGQPNYVGPTNTFDLSGRTLWFVAQQGGLQGYSLY